MGLADFEIERLCVGLAAQGEMPPFALDGIESVAAHDGAEEPAVGLLLRGDKGGGIMGDGVEEVEGGSHIHWLLGGKVEEGEVDGAAHGMLGVLGDVALLADLQFGEAGIVLLAHEGVGAVAAPLEDVVDSPLRTVGIVDEEHQALLAQFGIGASQRFGSLAGEYGQGTMVALERAPDEVVAGGVADVGADGGVELGYDDKTGVVEGVGRL